MVKPKSLMLTKEEIERLYLTEDKSQKEIAEIYGCDRKNIAYYLKKYDIPRKPPIRNKLPPLDMEKIESMINSGMTILEVAEKLNVSRERIGKEFKKLGKNMKNHEGQRKRQSKLMSEKNPVPKGSARPRPIIEAAIAGRKKVSKKRRENIKTYKQYASIARAIAYVDNGRGANVPEGLEIDHMFSVKDGWEYGIFVEDISHPANLRFITPKENRSKGDESIISFSEFAALVWGSKQ